MTENLLYSAKQLATRLGIDPPTAQQEAIVEAPLEGVYRVVAGAGSGKTETMALRVVWLVANQLVRPHEILGLTFTRKAASELGSRITRRIRALNLVDRAGDVFELPQVSTYNAFASRLFRDFGVFVGMDPDVDVAGSAAAWSLARRVVAASSHPGLTECDLSLDRVTTLTWQLAQAVSENAVDTDDLVDFAQRFQAVRDLPAGGRGGYPGVDKAADTISLLPVLAELAREFQDAKVARRMVEYSDQIRLGLDAAASTPEVVESVRARHAVVLLDEYQDTSVLQTRLLATLFADHPVMSVGDPLQAIYGWRGASGVNLDDFTKDFATQWPTTTFTLDTSWRNPHRVLDSANALCEPLRRSQPDLVPTLRASRDAIDGSVTVAYPDTVDGEAEAIAQWFSQHLASQAGSDTSALDAALLVRERKHQQRYADALAARGIPVHIVGVGGLLANPVVADLMCGLAIVHRAQANGELLRVLTQTRFRLGVSDLWALSQRARWLAMRDSEGGKLDDSLVDALENQATGRPRGALIDAVDYYGRLPLDHRHFDDLSAAGRGIVVEAASLISQQRRMAHLPIADQVLAWERAIGLDIEWRSHPQHASYREAREAFFDAIGHYQAISEEAGAAGFIEWLIQAEWRDSLQPQSAPPVPGAVQILTIHGAKGLEWDLVAVAGLSTDSLPTKPQDGYTGWLRNGVLPYDFRGDRAVLPVLGWANVSSRKELVDEIQRFSDDVRRHHEREERRLAYVAVTRAKRAIHLSGSFYAGQTTPRAPSMFLLDLEQAGHIDPLPTEPADPDTSSDDTQTLMSWPPDPLGSRRPAVEAAAAAVMARLESDLESANPETTTVIARVLDDERARMAPPAAVWPYRIPASQFDRWVFEPDVMLEGRSQPRPPNTGLSQQRGTQFHAWVESFFADQTGTRLLGDVDIDGDGVDGPSGDIGQWQEAFENSEYAQLTPLALEREIHLPLAGHLIICKVDAVFDRGGRIQIVDWKTGAPPRDAQDAARKALQLAVYRQAWASWSGIDEESIDAVLWFSSTGETHHPDRLASRAELEAMLLNAKVASTTAQPQV